VAERLRGSKTYNGDEKEETLHTEERDHPEPLGFMFDQREANRIAMQKDPFEQSVMRDSLSKLNEEGGLD
jgi:hypothetical protein